MCVCVTILPIHPSIAFHHICARIAITVKNLLLHFFTTVVAVFHTKCLGIIPVGSPSAGCTGVM